MKNELRAVSRTERQLSREIQKSEIELAKLTDDMLNRTVEGW